MYWFRHCTELVGPLAFSQNRFLSPHSEILRRILLLARGDLELACTSWPSANKLCNAARRSGYWKVKPFSKNRRGTHRRLVSTSSASVPRKKAPRRTASPGIGGLQGRWSVERRVRINS